MRRSDGKLPSKVRAGRVEVMRSDLSPLELDIPRCNVPKDKEQSRHPAHGEDQTFWAK